MIRATIKRESIFARGICQQGALSAFQGYSMVGRRPRCKNISALTPNKFGKREFFSASNVDFLLNISLAW